MNFTNPYTSKEAKAPEESTESVVRAVQEEAEEEVTTAGDAKEGEAKRAIEEEEAEAECFEGEAKYDVLVGGGEVKVVKGKREGEGEDDVWIARGREADHLYGDLAEEEEEEAEELAEEKI